MDLRLLRYFLAIVDAGSLHAAAARLGISQPSLSTAMARLEADLGVELLVRSTSGSEPTAAGRYLAASATHLLAEADDTRRALGGFADGTRGSLAIAVVPALAWHRMPSLLRELDVASDDVELSLVEAAPWTALDLLRTRAVDLAAILVADLDGFASRHRSDVRVVDCGDVPLVAALPPEQDAPPVVRLERLVPHTLFLPGRAPAVASLPEVADRYLADHAAVPARVRTVETIQTALALVGAGLGWAIAPDADGRSLARFDVAVRPLDPPPPALRAVFAVRAETPHGALARLLARTAGRAS